MPEQQAMPIHNKTNQTYRMPIICVYLYGKKHTKLVYWMIS